jgi:hypothetical protein
MSMGFNDDEMAAAVEQVVANQRAGKEVRELRERVERIAYDLANLQALYGLHTVVPEIKRLHNRVDDLLRSNNEFEARARKAERKLKAAVEIVALSIYSTWVGQRDWVPWEPHGNSTKQVEARRQAMEMIDRPKAKPLTALLESKERDLIRAARAWHKFQGELQISALYNACSALFGSDFNPSEYDNVE